MNFRHSGAYFLVFLALKIPLASPLLAQGNPTARVSGQVSFDGQGLPGATVTFNSPDFHGLWVVVTDGNGNYSSPPLPPGEYEISSQLEGFQTLTHRVRLGAAMVASLDFTLKEDDDSGEKGDEAVDIDEQADSYAHDEDKMGLVAVRDFLVREDTPPSGFGGYGYLIFTQRPEGEDNSRHTAVCEAFLAGLEAQEEFPGHLALADRMVTFWLLAEPLPSSKTGTTGCKEMIEYYDYARASIIASALGRPGIEGPMLVASISPFDSRYSRGKPLVLDLTLFSNTDLGRAVRIWKTQVSHQPEHWRDGFQLVKFRETFRNLLERYGQAILTVLPLPE